MTTLAKPPSRPKNPRFSSGPCAKHPGWSLDGLKGALVGRNHRQKETKARLELALKRTRELLKLPAGYVAAIVPASDTGAVEMALWSLLGPRGVDVLAWEAFSRDWVTDIVEQLKIKNMRALLAPYGDLPDLSQVDFDRDVVFAWNGTTSGVRVPNAEWIPEDRRGLVICDATSAVFAQAIDWEKLDVATFSWQKVLGGEAQHGILILSPRAIERLESYTPPWPLPKLFRMTRNGKLMHDLFEGSTINTPSMLCLEDYLDALAWVESIGGVEATIAARIGMPRSSPNSWPARPGSSFSRACLRHARIPRLVSGSSTRKCSRCRQRCATTFRAAWRRCSMPRMPPRTSPLIAMRQRASASGRGLRSRQAILRRCCPGSTTPSRTRSKPSPRPLSDHLSSGETLRAKPRSPASRQRGAAASLALPSPSDGALS